MRTRASSQGRQAGFMILEVLLALLIFSLGVLGLVGLQANAARQSGQSQYRATATVLANELTGRMWVGDRTSATLQATYGSSSTDAGFVAWKNKVTSSLPNGAATVTFNQIDALTPVVPAGTLFTPTAPTPSTMVTITVTWRQPTESVANTHNIVIVTQIK